MGRGKEVLLKLSLLFTVILVLGVGYAAYENYYSNYDPMSNAEQNPSVTAGQVWSRVNGEEGWLQQFIDDGALSGTTTQTILNALPTCSEGEILKNVSGVWACSNDLTGTGGSGSSVNSGNLVMPSTDGTPLVWEHGLGGIPEDIRVVLVSLENQVTSQGSYLLGDEVDVATSAFTNSGNSYNSMSTFSNTTHVVLNQQWGSYPPRLSSNRAGEYNTAVAIDKTKWAVKIYASVGSSSGSGTTSGSATMISGLPDALKCTITSGSESGQIGIYPLDNVQSDGTIVYRAMTAGGANAAYKFDITFTDSSAVAVYNSQLSGTKGSTDCDGKTLAELDAEGKTFNFGGSSSSGSSSSQYVKTFTHKKASFVFGKNDNPMTMQDSVNLEAEDTVSSIATAERDAGGNFRIICNKDNGWTLSGCGISGTQSSNQYDTHVSSNVCTSGDAEWKAGDNAKMKAVCEKVEVEFSNGVSGAGSLPTTCTEGQTLIANADGELVCGSSSATSTGSGSGLTLLDSEVLIFSASTTSVPLTTVDLNSLNGVTVPSDATAAYVCGYAGVNGLSDGLNYYAELKVNDRAFAYAIVDQLGGDSQDQNCKFVNLDGTSITYEAKLTAGAGASLNLVGFMGAGGSSGSVPSKVVLDSGFEEIAGGSGTVIVSDTVTISEKGLLQIDAYGQRFYSGATVNSGGYTSIKVDGVVCSMDQSFEGESSAIFFHGSPNCQKMLDAGTYTISVENSPGGTTSLPQYTSLTWSVIAESVSGSTGSTSSGTLGLDESVLIEAKSDAGTSTQANFDLTTLPGVTVPEGAEFAIIECYTLALQSQSTTHADTSSRCRLSHDGSNFFTATHSNAGSNDGFTSTNSRLDEDHAFVPVKIRDGKYIGYEIEHRTVGAGSPVWDSDVRLHGFIGGGGSLPTTCTEGQTLIANADGELKCGSAGSSSGSQLFYTCTNADSLDSSNEACYGAAQNSGMGDGRYLAISCDLGSTVTASFLYWNGANWQSRMDSMFYNCNDGSLTVVDTQVTAVGASSSSYQGEELHVESRSSSSASNTLNFVFADLASDATHIYLEAICYSASVGSYGRINYQFLDSNGDPIGRDKRACSNSASSASTFMTAVATPIPENAASINVRRINSGSGQSHFTLVLEK